MSLCLMADMVSFQICDVISKWEECFRDFHGGKSDSRSIKLLYKNRYMVAGHSTLYWIPRYNREQCITVYYN